MPLPGDIDCGPAARELNSVSSHFDTAILIPVFNDQSGLGKSLDSIEETLPLLVVVVDDGSNPPLQLEPSTYDFPILHVRLDSNAGIVHALNVGLTLCRSRGVRYLARLDAGDTWVPGRLEQQLQVFRSHPDCVLVGGWVRCVSPAGEYFFTLRYPTEWERIRGQMHISTCIAHPTVTFDLERCPDDMQYDNDFKYCEDYELFFKLSRSHEVRNLAMLLVNYEISPTQTCAVKRRSTLTGRFRVQLKYFEWRRWQSYYGVLQTVMLLPFPFWFVVLIKKSTLGRTGH